MKARLLSPAQIERNERHRWQRYCEVLHEAQLLTSELCLIAAQQREIVCTDRQRDRLHEIAERLRTLRGELLGLMP